MSLAALIFRSWWLVLLQHCSLLLPPWSSRKPLIWMRTKRWIRYFKKRERKKQKVKIINAVSAVIRIHCPSGNRGGDSECSHQTWHVHRWKGLKHPRHDFQLSNIFNCYLIRCITQTSPAIALAILTEECDETWAKNLNLWSRRCNRHFPCLLCSPSPLSSIIHL